MKILWSFFGIKWQARLHRHGEKDCQCNTYGHMKSKDLNHVKNRGLRFWQRNEWWYFWSVNGDIFSIVGRYPGSFSLVVYFSTSCYRLAKFQSVIYDVTQSKQRYGEEECKLKIIIDWLINDYHYLHIVHNYWKRLALEWQEKSRNSCSVKAYLDF